MPRLLAVLSALVIVTAGAAGALALATRSAHNAPAAQVAVTTADRGGTNPGAGFGAAARFDSITDRADSGRIRGSPTAPIWVIEGSDFQCPFCKIWHDSSYAAIVKEFVNTGKVRLAFLNFPVTGHVHAKVASEAAMCASAQRKFWEMHDALFATQAQWEVLPTPVPTFDSLAVKVGVNAPAWRSCMTTHATAAQVDADRDRLRGRGVNSTPTFFVGSLRVVGVVPTSAFRDSINKALAKTGKR